MKEKHLATSRFDDEVVLSDGTHLDLSAKLEVRNRLTSIDLCYVEELMIDGPYIAG